MSGFAALMKLSQTQTAQSELAVQTQIASHQTQLEKKRREQEVKERKERELEAKLRAKRFEEQRKEEERKRKREEEERAREKELAKREEQMRDALKYGPRKSSMSASRSRGDDKEGAFVGSSASSGGEPRGRRYESPDSSTSVLTREEKRERRLAAELRRSATSGSSSRRSGGSLGRTTSLPDGRTVRRLPGGAVDYTTVSRLADPDAAPALPSADVAGKSARERLAAVPSTLLKLNTVKRDLRTIDEILVDRAKAKQAKTLAGDEAKEFSDWFGKNKKKAMQPQTPQPTSTTSSRAVSTTPSESPAPPLNPFAGTSVTKSKSTVTSSKPVNPFFKPINPKPSVLPSSSRISSGAIPSPSLPKKRPRSQSDGGSPPPASKRRPATASRPAASSSRNIVSSRPSASSHGVVDIAAEIWSIFGKDKKSYTARDVLSDDEDMEADAESVLREELRSARLAHKEDEVALAEEKRHEEEKRRRRKERERRDRA